jgi:hypothetical protein
VKFSETQADGQLRLLIDDLLWINGDDKETLKKYGIDPENITNDYALYNEVEEWLPYITNPEATFRISIYDDEGFPKYQEVDHARFAKHLTEWEDRSILAKVTVVMGYIVAVNEIYVP